MFLVLATAMSSANAQAFEGGSRSAALADATVALIGVGSTIQNPAAAATQARPGITFTAGESYGLSSLRSASIETIVPVDAAAAAVVLAAFGDDAFRTISLRAAGATAFQAGTSRRMFAGAAVEYVRHAFRGYGADGTVVISGGVIAPVLPELSVAFAVTNITAAHVGVEEAIEQTIALGFSFTPEERVRLVGALVKEIRHAPSARTGIEASFLSTFSTRFGFGTKPTTGSVGIGVHVGLIEIDIALQRHRFLGWSSSGSLSMGMR